MRMGFRVRGVAEGSLQCHMKSLNEPVQVLRCVGALSCRVRLSGARATKDGFAFLRLQRCFRSFHDFSGSVSVLVLTDALCALMHPLQDTVLICVRLGYAVAQC